MYVILQMRSSITLAHLMKELDKWESRVANLRRVWNVEVKINNLLNTLADVLPLLSHVLEILAVLLLLDAFKVTWAW